LDPEPDPSRRDPEQDWDTSWDPAVGRPSGAQRFQPSGKAKTIVVVIVLTAMVVTVILLCVAVADLVNLILDPIDS
jgi:hypothetical protein